jgi:hypothetical protein
MRMTFTTQPHPGIPQEGVYSFNDGVTHPRYTQQVEGFFNSAPIIFSN